MGIAKRSLLAAATIAGASAIALGAGAGTANARYLGACAGTSISGQGATLQTVAQGLWISGFGGICPGVGVSYTGTGSGAGLNAWGADGLGGTPVRSGNAYIATDDAPNSGQIANIRRAANNADLAILADAQAAIAIIANVPSGCTVTQITNRVLEETYRGISHTWQDLPGGSGVAACARAITPAVRRDASGTTLNFKKYLFRINSGTVLGSSTWDALSVINGTSGTPNQTWPGSPIVAATTGGGGVITAVNGTVGAIGYVNLADAVRAGSTYLQVQNRTIPSVTYASPITASGDANCAGATYTNVPSAGSGRAVNFDWSNTFGVNPSVGGSTYPICILTYEVKLAGAAPSRSGTAGYTTAGFANGDAIATTASDYATYQESAAGQSALAGRGYAALSGAVLAASQAAAAEIW
jgi:phosphate transport system substrate-binding protein